MPSCIAPKKRLHDHELQCCHAWLCLSESKDSLHIQKAEAAPWPSTENLAKGQAAARVRTITQTIALQPLLNTLQAEREFELLT
jgi:hypothetical protein